MELGFEARALELLERAAAATEVLEPSQETLTLWINLGHSFHRIARSGGTGRSDALLRSRSLLVRAQSLARELEHPRGLSYALGNLAQLYHAEHRNNEALRLARLALRAAERASASESIYRWHWLSGQLLWKLGRAQEAVDAYRRAIAVLEESRSASQGYYGEAAAHFEAVVAPVYQGFVEVLLEASELLERASQKQTLLLEARSAVERLKVAELRNFFEDDCLAALEAKTADLDAAAQRAAIVYPIVLQDRLELLVTLPSGVERFSVAVTADELEQQVSRLRRQLRVLGSHAYRTTSEQLHRWLVEPFEARLAAEDVDTLVFVPDGALRSIPMAVLHDGQSFLIDRYALALAPSLQLVDPQPLDRSDMRILLAGVSESVQGFAALRKVPDELAAVRSLFGGTVLLDDAFRIERVEQEVTDQRPNIVHLASHAVFGGSGGESFLLTYDERLTLDDLSKVVGTTRFRDDPLEMLVLSACETAAGDERAGLGLAGVAVRAGARSALGSLWSIADEAAYELIVEFYRQIQDPSVSRAAALQRAQQKLRQRAAYAHPFYWSPFLMINNWL